MSYLHESEPDFYKLANYVDKSGGYPVCVIRRSLIFPLAKISIRLCLEELQKAQEFIFMEYFIIDDGEMWREIVKILLEKAKAGVEVRLLYDGMGSQFTLPFRYKKKAYRPRGKMPCFQSFPPYAFYYTE